MVFKVSTKTNGSTILWTDLWDAEPSLLDCPPPCSRHCASPGSSTLLRMRAQQPLQFPAGCWGWILSFSIQQAGTQSYPGSLWSPACRRKAALPPHPIPPWHAQPTSYCNRWHETSPSQAPFWSCCFCGITDKKRSKRPQTFGGRVYFTQHLIWHHPGILRSPFHY